MTSTPLLSRGFPLLANNCRHFSSLCRRTHHLAPSSRSLTLFSSSLFLQRDGFTTRLSSVSSASILLLSRSNSSSSDQSSSSTSASSSNIDSLSIDKRDSVDELFSASLESSSASEAALKDIGLPPGTPQGSELSSAASSASDPAAVVDAGSAAASAASDSLWFNVELAVRLIESMSNYMGASSWWLSIVAVTISVRLLTLPVVVASMRNTARMTQAQPEMEAAQREHKRALESAPPNMKRQVSLEQAQRIQDIYSRHNVSFSKMFLPLLVQAPLFITFFFALRHMSVSHAAEFAQGGALWFTDLGASDPYYRLPMLSGVTMTASMLLGADGMPEARRGPMRAFAFAMAPIMVLVTGSFPQALHVYWFTSNFFSVSFTSVMRNPQLRQYLDLTPLAAQLEKAKAAEVAHVGQGKVQFFESGRQAAADFRESPTEARAVEDAEIVDRSKRGPKRKSRKRRRKH